MKLFFNVNEIVNNIFPELNKQIDTLKLNIDAIEVIEEAFLCAIELKEDSVPGWLTADYLSNYIEALANTCENMDKNAYGLVYELSELLTSIPMYLVDNVSMLNAFNVSLTIIQGIYTLEVDSDDTEVTFTRETTLLKDKINFIKDVKNEFYLFNTINKSSELEFKVFIEKVVHALRVSTEFNLKDNIEELLIDYFRYSKTSIEKNIEITKFIYSLNLVILKNFNGWCGDTLKFRYYKGGI